MHGTSSLDGFEEYIELILKDPRFGFFLIASVKEDDKVLPIGMMMISFEWSEWRNSK
jgi:hypothetical protein